MNFNVKNLNSKIWIYLYYRVYSLTFSCYENIQLFYQNFSLMQEDEVTFLKSLDMDYIDSIGSGGYGTIHRVFHNTYKTYFALKKIPQHLFRQNEIDCLMLIDDPHIIRLYKYFSFKDFVYLLMDFCEKDLSYVFENKGLTKESTLKTTLNEIVRCVKACHDAKIAHNDIKPSNFLVDKYGRIIITDFGMSNVYCHRNPSSTQFKGTLYFMAPELFGIGNFNPLKADIWSLGVTMYWLATGKYPFNGLNQRAIQDLIMKGVYNEDLIPDYKLREVISRCLEPDPCYRADINELLGMSYFKQNLMKYVSRCNSNKDTAIVRPLTSMGRINKTRTHSVLTLPNIPRSHLRSTNSKC